MDERKPQVVVFIIAHGDNHVLPAVKNFPQTAWKHGLRPLVVVTQLDKRCKALRFDGVTQALRFDPRVGKKVQNGMEVQEMEGSFSPKPESQEQARAWSQLKLRVTTPRGKTVQIIADRTAKVGEVKRRVRAWENCSIPAEQLRLTGRDALNDGSTLQEAKVKNNDNLYLWLDPTTGWTADGKTYTSLGNYSIEERLEMNEELKAELGHLKECGVFPALAADVDGDGEVKDADEAFAGDGVQGWSYVDYVDIEPFLSYDIRKEYTRNFEIDRAAAKPLLKICEKARQRLDREATGGAVVD